MLKTKHRNIHKVALLLGQMQRLKIYLFGFPEDNGGIRLARKIEAAERVIGDEFTKITAKPL